jgi:hypothetical protein
MDASLKCNSLYLAVLALAAWLEPSGRQQQLPPAGGNGQAGRSWASGTTEPSPSSPSPPAARSRRSRVRRTLRRQPVRSTSISRSIQKVNGGQTKAMLYGSNAARMTGRIERPEQLAPSAHAIPQQSGDAYLRASARYLRASRALTLCNYVGLKSRCSRRDSRR